MRWRLHLFLFALVKIFLEAYRQLTHFPLQKSRNNDEQETEKSRTIYEGRLLCPLFKNTRQNICIKRGYEFREGGTNIHFYLDGIQDAQFTRSKAFS